MYTCEKKCCPVQIVEYPYASFSRSSSHLRRGNCRKAGVFIFDPEQNRVLLVQSRGHLWGPPKGSLEIERGETSCECAIREVKEETGLDVKATEFTRATKIKNRSIYYYLEKKACRVDIQDLTENDANGITWIKLDCLEECIESGKIVLNQHAKIVFKRFFCLKQAFDSII